MRRFTSGLAGISLITAALSATPAMALEKAAQNLDDVRTLALREAQYQRLPDGEKLGATGGEIALYIGGGLLAVGAVVGIAAGAGGGGSSGGQPNLPNDGGDNTGGDNTGGDNTGGDNTGGDNTGGDNTGGDNTGGDNTGGSGTGQQTDQFGRQSFPAVSQIPQSFEDAEYNNTKYLPLINASTAYSRDADGSGVIVAIIDTQFDEDHPEYAGRVHPASKPILRGGIGVPDILNPSNHGTAVANIAIGGRNGNGVHGVAFNATILGIGVASRSTSGQISDGDLIPDAIVYAAENGAAVSNHSFLSSFSRPDDHQTYDGPSQSFRAAYQTAIDADMMLVIAAGNVTRPNPSSVMAHDAEFVDGLKDHMIVAVATDAEDGLIADPGDGTPQGSDRCGVTKDWCMAAPGWRVGIMPNDVGDKEETANGSGTSFAAPVIAGAYALIKQTWPELTAKQIQTLLFATADDAGVAGVDSIYGQGILNLARAFTPFETLQAQNASGSGFSPEAGSTMSASGPSITIAAAMGAMDVVSRDALGRGFLVPQSAVIGGVSLTEIHMQNRLGAYLNHASRLPETAVTFLNDGLALAAFDDGFSQSVSLIGQTFALHGGVAQADHFNDTTMATTALSAANLRDFALANEREGFIRLDSGIIKFTAARGQHGGTLVDSTLALDQNTRLSVSTLLEQDRMLGLKGTGSFALKGRGFATTFGASHHLALGDVTFDLAAELGRFAFKGKADSFVRNAPGSLVSAHALANLGGFTVGAALPLSPFNIALETALQTTAALADFSPALEPRFMMGWHGSYVEEAVRLGLVFEQSATQNDRSALAHISLRF